ncbi:E3 ubiquitin-protein ligase E3D [Phytophthora nicotianae]|uniref:E3 ubiquitin-protein ligase E3D n=1 Tax=Phytophthora nicotianae TaxID=4792 RepID=A0A0W8DHD1_PHYNI|nr:E3 ubiquitin-protein ligase E3D [Phytophthora nicotianae]
MLLEKPEDVKHENSSGTVRRRDGTVRGCASTSHFRRLSWSPDGSVLCATHAFSSKKNIASLLNRGSWTNDLKFVGHQGVVTSARFNPKLLGDEIGTPISDAQQSKLLQAKYGSRAGITLASTLVENPIQLQLEEKSTTSPRLAVSQSSGTIAAPVVAHTTNTLIPKKKKKLGTQASRPAPKEKPAMSKTTDAHSKPSKMEVKKNGVDGNSLKRKRESERPPIHTTTVVAKSREVVARPPKLLNESEVKWIDRIPGRAVCAVGNASYCAIGVHNGDLLVLNSSGRRLFPAIGDLKIWNLAERKLVLSSSIEAITNLIMAWQGVGLHSNHLPSRISNSLSESTPPSSSCSERRARQLTIYPTQLEEVKEQQQEEAEATSWKPNTFLGPEDASSLVSEVNNQVDEDANEVATSSVVLLETGDVLGMEAQFTKRLSGDWISRPYKTRGEIHITYDVEHARYEGLPDAWRTLNQQFGLPLEKVPKREVKGYETKLPAVLEMMKTCFLAHDGTTTEGVFRLAPDKQEYNAIKAAINDGSFEDCSDVHIMASLIKVWQQ